MIMDAHDVIKKFSIQFEFKDDKSIQKLIKNIDWNTKDLEITTVNQVHPALLELDDFKLLVIKKLEVEISNIIESHGICILDDFKCYEPLEEIKIITSSKQFESILSKKDFGKILLQQYITFM